MTDAQASGGFQLPASSYLTPPRRPGVVARDDLVKGLIGSNDPVVVVSAPAGYGKTTTLMLWEDADERPFAWVHLGWVDNDPVHLAHHIAAALHEIEPISPVVSRSMMGPGKTLDEDLVPALGRVIEVRSPFVLVLDDVHLVTAEPSRRCLESLLAYLPDGAQVVLAARGAPPVPLARRRLGAGVTEVSTAELAMDAAEARQVLGHLGVTLGGDELDALVGQTEGWPAGVHLAGLALADGASAGPLPSFSGRDRLVADFLVEEVLDQLPDRTVDFLLRSSVLDLMTPSRVDELLDSDDSAARLEEIERSGNLFLVPLDRDRGSFRYHHLFGELLQSRLRAQDPDLARHLEARASELMEREGDVDAAIRHAVRAGDLGRAADLILARAPALVFGARADRLQQWLDLLGPAAVGRHPAAAVATAWLGVAFGDAMTVERAMAAAADVDHDGPLVDGSPSLAVAMAMVRAVLAMDGLEGVLRDTEIVRSGGGRATNGWWGVATAVQGTAFAQLGQLDLARSRLEEALPLVADGEGFEAGTVAHLALLDLQRGDIGAADRRSSRALEIAEVCQLDGTTVMASTFAIGALVAARCARPADARLVIAKAQSTVARMGRLAPRTRVMTNVLLADACLVLGDRAGAATFAAEASAARVADPTATYLNGLLDQVHEKLSRTPLTPTIGGPQLTVAELRVLDQLATHLVLKEIAEALYISRNTAKTHSIAIYRKLGVSSRSEAVAEGRRLGLLPD